MTDYVDTFEHAGLHVQICWEEYIDDNDNPRSNDGNLGEMFCDYSGYNLGDEDATDPREKTVTCDKCDGSGEEKDAYAIVNAARYGRTRVADTFPSLDSANRYIATHAIPNDERWVVEPKLCEACEGEGEVQVSIVEYLVKEHGARVVLPLFVYEHSGITMSCGANLLTGDDNLRSTGRFVGDAAGWDTSTVGVIFDTAESRKECGLEDATPEKIAEQLTNEVAYYAAYLEGSVYGYEVVQVEPDEDGEKDPETGDCEVLDACWGFLELNVHKDDAYVRVAARESAEQCAKNIVSERAKVLDAAYRDIETVG